MGVQSQLTAFHAQNASAFDKLSFARQHFDAMGQALGRLTALGQNVTRDDVMEQIMGLVQEGRLSSKEAAITMGQVPLQGPALAEWVQSHVARIAQMDQKAAQVQEHARKNMVTSAGHLLAMTLAGQSPAPAPAPQGNNSLQSPPQPQGGASAPAPNALTS